jgi:hypothetical protein
MTAIKSYLDNLYYAAYGSDADMSATSPDGQISGSLAEMFDDLNGIAQDTHRGLGDPNAATGQMLSGLMVLTGCPRNGSSKSTAPAIFIGTPGTVIDTTKVIQSTYDGSLWSPIAPATIGLGGTVSGTLQCNESGPPRNGRVPADSLTVIQTTVDGWDAVSNSVGVPGYNVESDPNARVRRQQSVAIASQGMTDGLQATLKKLPHVIDAVVWENDKSEIVVVGSSENTINPNSLRVFVRVDLGSSSDPAETTTDADPVANTIFLLKGHGCGTQGSITKHPLDAVGVAQTINYDLATPLSVGVTVTLSKRYNYPTDGDKRISDAITAWAAGSNKVTGKPNIQVSGNDKGQLSWTDVLAAFLNSVPGFDFVGLSFTTDAGTVAGNLPVPFGSFVEISSVSVVEV